MVPSLLSDQDTEHSPDLVAGSTALIKDMLSNTSGVTRAVVKWDDL